MDDGAIWSAQADFLARLADWDEDLILFRRCNVANDPRFSL